MSMTDTAVGSDGQLLPLASLEVSIVRDNDGNISSMEVVRYGKRYVQTYTRQDGKIVKISAWELQP